MQPQSAQPPLAQPSSSQPSTQSPVQPPSPLSARRMLRWLPLLACALLLVGFAVWLLALRLATPTGITVTWQGQPQGFTSSDQSAIADQLKTTITADSGGQQPTITYKITYAQRQGDYAVLGAEEQTPSGQMIANEGVIMLAQKQGGVWKVWLPSSPGFCAELNQLPQGMLSTDERSQFGGCPA
ncbi:MAG: hypothetical protein ABI068_06765 [Ktedonobacterales bacterium]